MGRVKAFDDALSWLHFFYAMVLAILSPIALIAGTMMFIAYQVYEREKWARKRGDFVEWLAGILIGVLVRTLVCGGV